MNVDVDWKQAETITEEIASGLSVGEPVTLLPIVKPLEKW